jgi:GT2 family glycosyltransferase
VTPLVTVAIPCFNAERWLRECIESALGQTWSDVEVIVVDDGSTDDSKSIAHSFGERVVVLEGEHRGGNVARNLALARARGTWVQFLDADDYLEPTKIAVQFEESNGGEAADVIYSPYFFEKHGGPAERWVSELDAGADLFTQWLSWELPQTGAVLWRKSALNELGGWKEDQPCCQEHELYLRALEAGLRFVFAPTPHAVYRLWSEQTVCRKDPRLTIRVRTQLLDKARTWLMERGRWTERHQRVVARACFEMARTLARDDRAAAAAYHAERKRAGLIRLEGPAAPLVYRMAYSVFGFKWAEAIAASRR